MNDDDPLDGNKEDPIPHWVFVSLVCVLAVAFFGSIVLGIVSALA